ncbi:unnamed protein product [Brassica oleracea var. botrytis]
MEDVPDISWGCEIYSKMAIHRVDIGERELLASQNLRKGELLSSSVWTNGEAGEMMKLFRKILDGLTISLLFRENRTRFYTGLRQNLICTWKLHRFENGQSKESLMLLGRSWRNLDFPPVQQMFWIELPMDDGKDRAMFVVFDKEMTKLTKQEAFVLALEEIPNSGDEELPSCLGELARKEFFFQIHVTLFNFTIPSLYDQLSLKISSLTIRLWWVNLCDDQLHLFLILFNTCVID